MNPDALHYYRKWLAKRLRPASWYLSMAAVAFAFFAFLACYFRLRTGDWSALGVVAVSAVASAATGALLITAVQTGALIGGWALLESFESGYRAGHFREVWRALMLKYRGLHPDVIAGDRFHRLFVAVGSDIVAHEELTSEQSQWMGDLLSTAKANLERAGGVSHATSKARFAKPLFIAYAVFAVLFAVIKLLEIAK